MPVCVVGYGSIDVLDNNSKDSFQKMLDNKDYVRDLHVMQDYQINKGYLVDESNIVLPNDFKPRSLTKEQLLAMHAANQALLHSGLPIVSDVATIVSSTTSEGSFVETGYERVLQDKKVMPRKIFNKITDMITFHIANHWGFQGFSTSVAAACATGLVSIDYAMRLVDEYEYVVVGCSDAGCYPLAIKCFNQIGAISNSNKPFDDNRSGFVMGEGAGVLILQSEKKANEYNSTIHAKLYPTGHASEGVSLTAPSEDGRGAKASLSKALKNANYPQIDAVCSHGTSTPVGDPIEYLATCELVSDAKIWAPKSKVGHTIAAAGILETIYCIESMKNKVIPHIQNLENCSFDIDKRLAWDNSILASKKKYYMVNNSFGFGGKNMSQVIECEETK